MRLLRGHHLICLHFFNGEGYDDIFVKNLEKVLEDVCEGGGRIVEGADDVCRACPHLRGGRCSYKKGEDEIRRLDELALSLLGLGVGDVVRWDSLESRLRPIFQKWVQAACAKCDWRKVCGGTEMWRWVEP
jgi:hypothetical protein